jgi:very-short-patch-repair endonuclease
MYPVRRQISPHAARLRRDATDVEQKVWAALRNRQLLGWKFRRQATIGPFVVDFLCVEAALVVELDGGQHDEDADAGRTAYLESKGLRVIRFWNHEVLENFEGVIEAIGLALEGK